MYLLNCGQSGIRIRDVLKILCESIAKTKYQHLECFCIIDVVCPYIIQSKLMLPSGGQLDI
jgi:hypothetical protein